MDEYKNKLSYEVFAINNYLAAFRWKLNSEMGPIRYLISMYAKYVSPPIYPNITNIVISDPKVLSILQIYW